MEPFHSRSSRAHPSRFDNTGADVSSVKSLRYKVSRLGLEPRAVALTDLLGSYYGGGASEIT
jgi:hypothetical protein